jgi:hypothetical protein
MFDNLGIEWAATLLGCLAAICVPIPICFYIFGKKLRMKSSFAPTMAPPKKLDEESDGGSVGDVGEEEKGKHDDDTQHGMSALHATRTAAHHELPMRLGARTRTRSAGTAAAGVNSNGPQGQGVAQQEKLD